MRCVLCGHSFNAKRMGARRLPSLYSAAIALISILASSISIAISMLQYIGKVVPSFNVTSQFSFTASGLWIVHLLLSSSRNFICWRVVMSTILAPSLLLLINYSTLGSVGGVNYVTRYV
jgi:ABC-type transport system involved in cytochrome c biogenesis permease subunit